MPLIFYHRLSLAVAVCYILILYEIGYTTKQNAKGTIKGKRKRLYSRSEGKNLWYPLTLYLSNNTLVG